MADPKKPAEPKPITDVAQPGKSAPSPNSKSVILNSRPIMKDPMVADTAKDGAADKPKLTAPSGRKIQPLDAPAKEDKLEDKPAPAEEPKTETASEAAPEPDKAPADELADESDETADETDDSVESGPDKNRQASLDKQTEAAKAAAMKREAELQKLIDSKKYFLPINSVEKRRSKRFVALGIFLSVVLLLAWVNVALDAGLIDLGGIKPVTHFFSN